MHTYQVMEWLLTEQIVPYLDQQQEEQLDHVCTFRDLLTVVHSWTFFERHPKVTMEQLVCLMDNYLT